MNDKTLDEMIIKTRKKFHNFNIGNNQSLFRGTGIDFEELREYNSNDDIRHINWKVTAQMQSLYVNVFNEEKELNVVPFFLVSGNIYFGIDRQKQELMSEILSLISFATTEQNDILNVHFYSEKSKLKIEPSKKTEIVPNIIKKALNLKPFNHKINHNNLVNFINDNVKKKSLLFLIGDFLEEKINFSELNNYEVFCIIVRDKFEEKPLIDENVEFVDLINNNIVFDIDIEKLEEYTSYIKKQDTKLFTNLESNKISYTKIYTDEEPFEKLNKLFLGVK